jgi:L-fucose isomerase-like protein
MRTDAETLERSMTDKMQFGFVTTESAPTGERRTPGVASEYAAALKTVGGEEWKFSDVDDPAPLVVLVESGGTERTIMDIWRMRLEYVARAPILLVAHPGGNSLPAALETLARMRQDGHRGRVLYLKSPGDEQGLAAVSDAARDVEARRLLIQSKIGLIGSPSGWLVASSPDREVVRSVWGPHIVRISLEEFIETLTGTDVPDAVGEPVDAAAREVCEPTPVDVASAERLYRALGMMAEKDGFDAVALRCFDLVEELGTTGCVALSRLGDDGITAGCEGDVVSTVAMLWIRFLLGEVSWMANPAAVDVAANSLTLAHCTIPRRMVEDYALRSHFESGLGVAIAGRLPDGPVTLVRIGGRSMARLWLAEGEVTGAGSSENMCRTQAEVTLVGGGGTVAELLERPLGNHVVVVRGHHADRLHSWWKMIIARDGADTS